MLLLDFQQFIQGAHYFPMRVLFQFFGGGHSVGDAGKVHSGCLGCFSVYRTVADVESLGFVGVQLLDGEEQSFGRWLGGFHILAAHDDVHKVFGEMLVEELLDAESVFGRDDSDAGAGVLQCGQYGFGLQKKHRIDGHVRIGLF